jgi:hypothetical protein
MAIISILPKTVESHLLWLGENFSEHENFIRNKGVFSKVRKEYVDLWEAEIRQFVSRTPIHVSNFISVCLLIPLVRTHVQLSYNHKRSPDNILLPAGAFSINTGPSTLARTKVGLSLVKFLFQFQWSCRCTPVFVTGRINKPGHKLPLQCMIAFSGRQQLGVSTGKEHSKRTYFDNILNSR